MQKVFVLDFSLERMGIKRRTHCFYALFFLLVGFQDSVQGRLLLINKPDPKDPAASARWLVSQNSWGVLKYVFSPPSLLKFISVGFFLYLSFALLLVLIRFFNILIWFGFWQVQIVNFFCFFLVPVPFQVIWEEHHLGMFCHCFCYRVLS